MQGLLEQVKAYIHDVENPGASSIRYSMRDNWQEDFDIWANENRASTTFSQLIISEIRRKGLSSVAFYEAAGLDRKLFSRLVNNPHYQPSKRTAIMCCLALKLDIRQTEHVLQLAGYALSRTLYDDLAVRYCIQHGVFEVMDVLEVMERLRYADDSNMYMKSR